MGPDETFVNAAQMLEDRMWDPDLFSFAYWVRAIVQQTALGLYGPARTSEEESD
jgi:hypothetical protein